MEVCKRAGFKQYKIAEILNMTPQQISHYACGQNQVPFDVLVKLAIILDCSCADLIDPRDFDSLKATVEDIKRNRFGNIVKVGDVEDE